MDSGAYKETEGPRIGHFVEPVEFTISRFFRCFACSLSLIRQGNQLKLVSFSSGPRDRLRDCACCPNGKLKTDYNF